MPPGQQLVDPIDVVVSDRCQNIGEPSLQIDPVEVGRFFRTASHGFTHSMSCIDLFGGTDTGFNPE